MVLKINYKQQRKIRLKHRAHAIVQDKFLLGDWIVGIDTLEQIYKDLDECNKRRRKK